MARTAPRKGKSGVRRGQASLVRHRMAAADEMAKSPTMTVTLRIPGAFNEWLDAYRHLSYPERVGKQALVVEGLKLAYLLRGRPGEPVLAIDEVFRSSRKQLGRG